MNASKLFAAVAAIAFAGSAFAADTTAANASVTATAAAQVSVAAQSLNVPATLVNKSAGASRAQIRAEAVEANKNRRSSEASQFDWITQ
jgi:hypothetical protein